MCAYSESRDGFGPRKLNLKPDGTLPAGCLPKKGSVVTGFNSVTIRIEGEARAVVTELNEQRTKTRRLKLGSFKSPNSLMGV